MVKEADGGETLKGEDVRTDNSLKIEDREF